MILQIKPVLDVATLYLVLGVSGTVIIIMLGIIGWFFKRMRQKDDDSFDKLADTVSRLDGTVTKLEVLWKTKDEVEEAAHKVIDVRLREHGYKIDEHEKKIAVLESKIA